MFSRLIQVVAAAAMLSSLAHGMGAPSTEPSSCVKKGNKTYCGKADVPKVESCPFESTLARRTLTNTEIQKCLLNVPLFCSQKVVVGQGASILLSNTSQGLQNSGLLERGLFAIGQQAQVYKTSKTPSINACLKANSNGRIFFTYGTAKAGEMCNERGVMPKATLCWVQQNKMLADASQCLAKLYRQRGCAGLGRSTGGGGGDHPPKGGNTGGGNDGGNNDGTGNDNGTDNGTDNGVETGTGNDTGMDNGVETGTGNDTGMDNGVETGTGNDTGMDNGVETGTGNDTGMDNGVENGKENGRENGKENGRENGKENGRENGKENGRENGGK